MRHNLIGTQNRLFAEPAPGLDETVFQVDNTSAAYYNSPYGPSQKFCNILGLTRS
jgi:hypothetical protein